ncbi:MAG TPA: PKD domain-containing protein, partial [Bacteroidales bacterium]|nr:PKD domain-containing protein [Bacteroidales bacterium]
MNYNHTHTFSFLFHNNIKYYLYSILFVIIFVLNSSNNSVNAQCIGYSWATWTNQGTTNSATATIQSPGQPILMTMTTNYNFSFTVGIFGYGNFSGFPYRPISGIVPRPNFAVGGVTTVCFSEPVQNPVLLFASLGSVATPVTLSFSVPYAVLYNSNGMTYIDNMTMTGTEGYCIIEFPGIHNCITINSNTPEVYTNLTWGVPFPQEVNFGYTQDCPGVLEFHDSTTFFTNPPNITGWNWNFGDGFTSNQQNPIHYYTNTGNYIVRLIVTFRDNCKDTISQTITVNQTANVLNPQIICSGDSITVNAHTYYTSGTYYDTVATAGGCDSIYVTMLTVTPLPSIGNHAVSSCSGVPFVYAPVNAGGDIVPAGTAYSWAAPGVPGITGTASGTLASVISGTLTNSTNSAISVPYIVTPINANCPGDTFIVNVLVNPMPAITDTNILLCSGSSFLFTPANGTNGIVPSGTTYSWPNPNIATITGDAAGSNAPNIGATLTNTTNAPVNVVYTVTPKSGTCTGASFTVT